MRPLFLDFEEDYPGSYNNDYQYMFGDDILVAPVTKPRVAEWTVYLPGKLIRNICDFQILLKTHYFYLYIKYSLTVEVVFYWLGNEKWIWLWNDDQKDPEVIEGPASVSVNATMGYPPVFYRHESKWANVLRKIASNHKL